MNSKREDPSAFEMSNLPREDSDDASFETASKKSVSAGKHRSPVTISLLFYVVTLGAILAACLRSLVGGDAVTPQTLAQSLILMSILGVMSGAVLGLFYLRSWRAVLIGVVVGVVVGCTAGGLALIDPGNFFELALLTFVGCWLLILTMLLSARFGPKSMA